MLILQLILYCRLFTAMVRLAVRGGAADGLYIYPKPVQERAFSIGLRDRDTIARKRRQFMTAFYLVMLTALVLIITVWNRITAFKAAYWQELLFLEVMNVYDGIVIDKLWVGHSKFWILPGTEDLPFVQTWAQVAKKRAFLAWIWVGGAAIAAGIAVLLAQILYGA